MVRQLYSGRDFSFIMELMHSGKLRDSMAELARQLSNSIFEWSDIHALMANHLIALDKCPGVRPIGIGEEPRRILGKAIALATRYEVEDVCGASQLCSGLKSGIEGAVHALREVFTEKAGTGWGVLRSLMPKMLLIP